MLAATFPPAAAARRGPGLLEPRDRLEGALACPCPAGLASAGKRPVLLHGTAATPDDAWSWNFERALPPSGHPTCTVHVPDGELDDMQRSVSTSCTPFGRSPGVVAGASRSWATAKSSRLLAAYRAGPLPARPVYTSIVTLNDEVVFPQPQASTLERGRTIAVQSVCPRRVVDHLGIVGDAVVYALAVDAITHRGAADPARIPRSLCAQPFLPGADLAGLARVTPRIAAAFATAGLHGVRAEPPLRCYLLPAWAVREKARPSRPRARRARRSPRRPGRARACE